MNTSTHCIITKKDLGINDFEPRSLHYIPYKKDMLFIVSKDKVLIVDIAEIEHCQVDLISKIEDDLTRELEDDYNIAVMDGYILLFSEKLN